MNTHANDTIQISILDAHPGVILLEEYLKPSGITPYRFAKAIGLSQSHVADLLKGKRNITAETAILVAEAVGTSAELWLGIQSRYDLLKARRAQAGRTTHIARLIPAP